MSITFYAVSSILVFVFSGLIAMAGFGAAFLYEPLFYYMGMPLAEAAPAALLLNVVSWLFATINYWRGKLTNWHVGVLVLISAVIVSALGARLTLLVNKTGLLTMFAAFLVFSRFLMLFYKAKARQKHFSRPAEIGLGVWVRRLEAHYRVHVDRMVALHAAPRSLPGHDQAGYPWRANGCCRADIPWTGFFHAMVGLVADRREHCVGQ